MTRLDSYRELRNLLEPYSSAFPAFEYQLLISQAQELLLIKADQPGLISKSLAIIWGVIEKQLSVGYLNLETAKRLYGLAAGCAPQKT